MGLVRRARLLAEVRRGLKESPVTSLLGPRQCGKTTLAREAARGQRAVFFDLESPRDLQRLADPQAALEPLRGLVVIDEIQRRPALYELLRVLADRRHSPARFLLLGSADPAVIRRTSESLAGRVRFVGMGGFALDETGPGAVERLWWRGGFPLAYRAASDGRARRWTEDFVRTFLERDLPQLEVRVPAEQLRRFWTMIAHAHGQAWNASEI
ncbi:MAG: AAA family ATPase, partial [bacterium]